MQRSDLEAGLSCHFVVDYKTSLRRQFDYQMFERTERELDVCTIIKMANYLTRK